MLPSAVHQQVQGCKTWEERMHFRFLFGIAAALIAAAPSFAQEALPSAPPESLGFSKTRLALISETLRDDVSKGKLPGAVLLIARDGKVGYFEAFGAVDPQTKAPMPKDAIFRIYSMTKPFTSVAAMMLMEDGKINLSDPVSKYIPAYKDMNVGIEKQGQDGKPTLETAPARRQITVYDLLRHVSGLTYGGFGDNLVKAKYREANIYADNPDNATFAERVAKLPLMFHPGSTWEYSVATDVLGRVVEVASGQSLYEFLKDRLFDPLGMNDTAFFTTEPSKNARIAEPFETDRRLESGALMFDPRQSRKFESGGGGGIGTAMDYAKFLQMMLDGGSFGGKRHLGPKTVAFMTTDHVGENIAPGPAYLPGPGYGFGLGFAVRRSNGQSPLPGTAGDYSWGGAGGTFMWVDPKERMFVVWMAQAPKERLYYRSLVKNMVYSALDRSERAAAQN
jgi:CubicO group peptidase (beta-lactamase class C family)